MADYFLKTDGSDGNDGTTWANAKATLSAGLALCTTAGDRLVVAAGSYSERSAATPGGAGSRGTNSAIYGDYDGTVVDGDTATSGVTGYIKFDGSKTTANKGWEDAASVIFGASDNWAYWDFYNIWCTGDFYVGITLSTPGAATDGNVVQNCMFESLATNYILLWDAAVDPDTYSPVTFDNCVFIGHRYNASTAPENGAIQLRASKSGGFPTAAQAVFTRCVFAGVQSGVGVYGTGATAYTKIAAYNCIMYPFNQQAGGVGYPNAGSNATYSHLDSFDCAMYGEAARITLAGADTRPASYYNTSVAASTMSAFPHLPVFPYLYPGSPLINANASNGQFPDIWGTAIQGNADYGAQEYVTGQYPLEPNMDITNLTTVTPGPSTGGGVSRGRIVNAGGI